MVAPREFGRRHSSCALTARATIVVSKKADDVYDLLVWRKGTPARLLAAWKVLHDAGFTKEDARTYRTTRRLERAIAAAKPLRDPLHLVFGQARLQGTQCCLHDPLVGNVSEDHLEHGIGHRIELVAQEVIEEADHP